MHVYLILCLRPREQLIGSSPVSLSLAAQADAHFAQYNDKHFARPLTVVVELNGERASWLISFYNRNELGWLT